MTDNRSVSDDPEFVVSDVIVCSTMLCFGGVKRRSKCNRKKIQILVDP